MNGAVEEIQKGAPLFKDGFLVFFLRQLIIDVLILNRLGVVVVRYSADPVREHALERNGLLCRSGDPVVFPGISDDLSHLLLLALCQIGRHVQISFFLFVKQAFCRKQ